MNQTFDPENRQKFEKFIIKTYLIVISVFDFVLIIKNIKIAPPLLLWTMLAFHIFVPVFLYKKRKLQWPKTAIISLTLLILCMSLASLSGIYHKSKKHSQPEEYTSVSATVPTLPPAVSQNVIDNLDYETPYILNRDDGRTRVYVLLKPVTPSKKEFQANIKAIINILASQCGPKTSIEFYDDRDLLDIAYQYKSKDEPAPLKYHSRLARHLIAMFDGELSNFTYPNSISFFPATDTQESPKLAPYISTIEYNPVVSDSQASPSTSESTSTPISSKSDTDNTSQSSIETAYFPQAKVDAMIKKLKKTGIIMSLKPEVNTVYIPLEVWQTATLEDKKNMHLFLSSYCVYHCAVKSLIVHIKDGYTDQLLGETDFLDHGLLVKN